jgi:hypothetical protein
MRGGAGAPPTGTPFPARTRMTDPLTPQPSAPEETNRPSAAMPPIQRWTIERIGTLRDSFDEACQHVLAESGAPELRLELSLGPLLDLRMAEVEPGSMGWVRTLHSKSPVNPADPNTGGAIGSLYFVVVPDDGPDITKLPRSSPIRGKTWESFTFVEEWPGPPRSIVMAHSAPTGERVPLVRRFAEAVWNELDSDLRTPGD